MSHFKPTDIVIRPLLKYIYAQTQQNTTEALKKRMKVFICSNMDGLGRYYAKWNKSKKKTIISLICGIQKL